MGQTTESKKEPGAMHRAAAASMNKSGEWYKDWAAQQMAEAQQRSQKQDMRRSGARDPFRYARAEQIRMTTQHWDEVLKEVKKDPEMRRFVGTGMQAKLMCQLSLILATLLNLALFAYAKMQRSRSTARGSSHTTGVDKLLRSIGLS